MDEQHSILFSTHITSDLEKIADYVVMLHNGRVILDEQKDKLIYQYGIWRGRSGELEELRGMLCWPYAIPDSACRRWWTGSGWGGTQRRTGPSIDEIMLHLIRGGGGREYERTGAEGFSVHEETGEILSGDYRSCTVCCAFSGDQPGILLTLGCVVSMIYPIQAFAGDEGLPLAD